MKIRKQEYGNCNMVGKNIERLRKEKGIKQKDFIAKIQTMGCDMNPTRNPKLKRTKESENSGGQKAKGKRRQVVERTAQRSQKGN